MELENVAIRKLKREFYKTVSEADKLDAEFYVDVSTSEYYQWKFELPHDNRIHFWKYVYKTKEIQKKVQS